MKKKNFSFSVQIGNFYFNYFILQTNIQIKKFINISLQFSFVILFFLKYQKPLIIYAQSLLELLFILFN